MVDYTIFVLDESDLTVTSPTGLDGVTQGDGSHLNGQTLTINNPNWTAINIRDNDNDFSDNDNSQRLEGAQEIDGVVYPDNTIVEAEFSFEATYDGVTYTLIGFNVRNSSSPFATIEGIAVVGGPGGFPPPNVPLLLGNASEGPSFAAASYATPICFDIGTPILTPDGYRVVEDLIAGDLVSTMDDGAQPIRWISKRRAFGIGSFAPVEITTGAMGNSKAVRVSQQHRVLVQNAHAELMFGGSEVFVPARALLGRPGIRLVSGARVHYHHLLLDKHAVLDCAGIPMESFLPSAFGLSQLSARSLRELEGVLSEEQRLDYHPARPVLRGYEASALLAA